MLKFVVNGQSLNRVDSFRPVEKSINYLTAEFLFTKDWEGLDKKAVCRAKGSEIEFDAHIEGSSCLIPWEVISEEGSFDICLKGSGDNKVITTSIVTVDIGDTLMGGAESNPPSETEIEWIRSLVAEIGDKVDAIDTKVDSRTLIVSVSDDMTTASHSVEEIYDHIMNGGEVFLNFMGAARLNFVGIDERIIFSTVFNIDNSTQTITVFVGPGNAVSLGNAQLVSLEEFESRLPLALPNPKELVINGTSYDGSRSVSISIPSGNDGVDGKDGKDGRDGKDGTNGRDGKDGISPHIGVNGNWWVGETDTGVKASGSSGGGALGYAAAVDDITVDTEGLTELELSLDLTACYEARIFVYVPATSLGSNYTYYLITGDGAYQNNLCNLSALTNNSSASLVHYRGLTETLGEIMYATGIVGGNISETDKIGGQGNVQAAKAPRLIHSGTKLVSSNKTAFSFPVNTRVMTFAWLK